MAYYYDLSIECGQSLTDVSLCSQHFEKFTIEHDSRVYDFITEQHEMMDEGKTVYWIKILSLQLPTDGITDKETADLFTIIGNEFLKHLAMVSYFRFAILGVESLGAIEYTAIDENLEIDEKFIDSFNGLVISKEMLSKVINKAPFSDFGTKHVAIIPYRVKFRQT